MGNATAADAVTDLMEGLWSAAPRMLVCGVCLSMSLFPRRFEDVMGQKDIINQNKV